MQTTITPKVTVLISTFNRPQYLEEAIDSVIKQRLTNWELIVINDGGVDVQHVVDKFADDRIIYVHDPVNKGAAPRFNQGLKMARGEYIAYLGDDDLFYPNHLEVLAKALDEHPEVALSYSDLYAVSSVADPETGKRFALDRRISVSRSFNREFMFHYNHVLHVSLMHRREAALRVGGFDESVKVLIEWSLNRRLAFLYDFYHVEEATGEYYMPIFKSDRISVRERRNQESYKHNLRRIRCSNPAEPWSKIETIDLLYVVNQWGEKLNTHLKEIIDNFDHPLKIVLINNGTGKNAYQCKESLGELAELKNLKIHHLSKKEQYDCYAFRKAASKSTAKYLFLVTPNLQAVKSPKRLFATLDAFKMNPEIQAINWSIKEENATSFDCLILRDYFLETSKPNKENRVNFQAISIKLAKGFKFDAMYSSFKKAKKEKNYEEARSLINAILEEKEGAPHMQYLIHDLAPICLAQKDYGTLEKELKALIARNYKQDNLIRLGIMYYQSGRYPDAINTLKEALTENGLAEETFDAKCFPFKHPRELGVFHLVMALAESYYELGDYGLAARYYHMASKMKSDSHKPFLGFAKVYMLSGQIEKAEAALYRLPNTEGKNDPETHRLLAKLCQKRKNLPLAFDCLLKAVEVAPFDPANIEPLYFTGAALGRWEAMAPLMQNFVNKYPNNAAALSRLCAVYFNMGAKIMAKKTAENCLLIEANNPIAKSILNRATASLLESNEIAPKDAANPIAGLNGLSLDFDQAGISW